MDKPEPCISKKEMEELQKLSKQSLVNIRKVVKLSKILLKQLEAKND